MMVSARLTTFSTLEKSGAIETEKVKKKIKPVLNVKFFFSHITTYLN
jgi:hypothetical protein